MKYILLAAMSIMSPCFCDPGITIEIDIFTGKPSGPANNKPVLLGQ